MSDLQVLLVAGTHGNEINASWLLDQWKKNPGLIKTHGLGFSTVIGNPLARQLCKRYIDRDLNRSFSKDLLNSSKIDDYEIKRAKELLDLYGSRAIEPCQIAIDFHSTTSSMGSSLVVYGRRPADLALAGLIQNRLGLPIYLHEGEKSQTGFLVESWPCGMVVEIGPVSQGVLHNKIINQTLIALQTFIDEIALAKSGKAKFPKNILVHRHLKSIDFPRDESGNQCGFIHSQIQGKDWIPINRETPLFEDTEGNTVKLFADNFQEDLIPVFINEAAYLEKGIAMSLTVRESWRFERNWYEDLKKIVIR